MEITEYKTHGWSKKLHEKWIESMIRGGGQI